MGLGESSLGSCWEWSFQPRELGKWERQLIEREGQSLNESQGERPEGVQLSSSAYSCRRAPGDTPLSS